MPARAQRFPIWRGGNPITLDQYAAKFFQEVKIIERTCCWLTDLRSVVVNPADDLRREKTKDGAVIKNADCECCISGMKKATRIYSGEYFITRWWFQRSFIFTTIWGRFPIWLTFFKGVGSTTNQRSHEMPTDLVIINHSGWAGLMVHVIQSWGSLLFVVFVPCIPSLKLT